MKNEKKKKKSGKYTEHYALINVLATLSQREELTDQVIFCQQVTAPATHRPHFCKVLSLPQEQLTQ